MKIDIRETNGSPCLLEDLPKYIGKPVEEYLRDIVAAMRTENPAASGIAFIPIELSVKIGDENIRLIFAGEVENDAEESLKRIAKLPEYSRIIPNDTMEIIADTFEAEMYVKLDPNVKD